KERSQPLQERTHYVGFATLPNQVHRKTVKKGFTFTLMVAGESGLGKSTLINSLFLTDLYKDRKVPNFMVCLFIKKNQHGSKMCCKCNKIY
uniref:Septin-5-like n=1 Tax=Stegastes partitus TaxID=144197 RepID=A0A3B4ZTN4_9TELE